MILHLSFNSDYNKDLKSSVGIGTEIHIFDINIYASCKESYQKKSFFFSSDILFKEDWWIYPYGIKITDFFFIEINIKKYDQYTT